MREGECHGKEGGRRESTGDASSESSTHGSGDTYELERS